MKSKQATTHFKNFDDNSLIKVVLRFTAYILSERKETSGENTVNISTFDKTHSS